MKLTRTPSMYQHCDYNIKLTKGELLNIANDGISDFFYINQMLDLIKKEAKKLDDASRESGQGKSGDSSDLPSDSLP